MAESGSPAVSLELKGLSRRFGNRMVFSGIDAQIASGGTIVISGPNGSGKSTLLRIVAGLLRPTSGNVQFSFDGRPLDPGEIRRSLGYVAPDLFLYSELTGAENLEFFGRLRGLALQREDLITLLERVGLKGRGRDLVGNYSSGMRQRLKYAFALMHRPAILLLDEPTANLDAQGAEMVKRVIDEQRDNGITVIATNEVRELEWGDSVVRLVPA